MISTFLREQKRYTQQQLCSKFDCSEEKTVQIIKRLKEYGVLKAVKASDAQKNMTDLVDDEIVVADVEVGENEFFYVFTFVGVITVSNCVVKCYPKYLQTATHPVAELKQVIKVLEKYNSKEQIIRMYNDSSESRSFNLLAVMLFLLHDYYENGSYTNTREIVESNGSNEILWDKTINETFTLISNNRPYYTDLQTRKRISDDFDYFKRLHECVLSLVSKELQKSDLLDLFDIMPADVSDEDLEDFGDRDYILYRIEKELNIQFNTRKQLLLKTLYAYIAHSGSLNDVDCFTMFGTNSFNLVWEGVCADVMDNQLQTAIGSLRLPVPLQPAYQDRANKPLISLIDKPVWYASDSKVAGDADTLIPDLISIIQKDGVFQFIIFDAKYYNTLLKPGTVRGQPGIESVTKQYLYQLAYQKFVTDHNISVVYNCFLMPTDGDAIQNKGYVSMAMLDSLGLQSIQVRFLPAGMMFNYYLAGTKIDMELLAF